MGRFDSKQHISWRRLQLLTQKIEQPFLYINHFCSSGSEVMWICNFGSPLSWRRPKSKGGAWNQLPSQLIHQHIAQCSHCFPSHQGAVQEKSSSLNVRNHHCALHIQTCSFTLFVRRHRPLLSWHQTGGRILDYHRQISLMANPGIWEHSLAFGCKCSLKNLLM